MLLKRIIPWLFVCSVASLGCSHRLPPEEHNNFHPYHVRHAALHFEYFGDVRGTEDFFIDSFGTREAHIVHSELITNDGFHPTITYSVRTGSELVVVDSVKDVMVKLIDRPMDSIYHLLPADIPTVEGEFQNIFGPRGYHPAGDTTILGLKAHVWAHAGTPGFMFEWGGLLMGSTDNIQGHVHELRLLSIDTTTPIDPARFILPTGFPMHDLTKMNPGEPGPALNP